MMYVLNILSTMKNRQSKNSETLYMETIIVELDLLKKTVIINEASEKRIHYQLIDQINKNTKEYYQPYLKRNNTKLVKPSKLITQQPKYLENQNISDIKSMFLEHPKTSRKLSKTKDFQNRCCQKF